MLAATLLAVGASMAAVPGVAGSGRDEGARALGAREGGRILALATIIDRIDAVIPGRLLDAELDDDDGITVYEIRWQLPDGRRLEIEVDAHDGQWRELKGARLETVFRRSPAVLVAPGGAGR
ncbi:MAG TPA: PepSY domain-containing protein [Methylibium sp.]|uniref:PepSY domain-containing protein n=1 Tax=Methylibium sp. TaxID=2067992 RepID=UPI002DBDDA3D|nr:PepSY domain-containing protein [Methylibium sp.]HEU4458566.1 PepSY domain-containing protein [Methylibium sp.]